MVNVEDVVDYLSAIGLYILSMAISYVVVKIAQPIIFALLVLILTYYLLSMISKKLIGENKSAIELVSVVIMGLIGSIELSPEILAFAGLSIVGSVIFSIAVITYLEPLIEVLTFVLLSFIIWKYLLKHFSREVYNELSKFLEE